MVPTSADQQQGSASKAGSMRLEWIERTLGTDIVRNDMGPGVANPRDVLDAADLPPAQKRDALYRWAYDSYLLARSRARGNDAADCSRMSEVIDALLDLQDMQARVPGTGPVDHQCAA